MIDCEHGPMSLTRSSTWSGAEVFALREHAQFPTTEDSTILRFLDRGVQGIIVPHVNSAHVAEGVARAARYHPTAIVEWLPVARARYGVGTTRDESTRWCELAAARHSHGRRDEAVNNLDAILKVSGVDVLHVASSDLGQSMGIPARRGEQVMRELIPRIRQAQARGCRRNSPSDAAVSQSSSSRTNLVTISSLASFASAPKIFASRVQVALKARKTPYHRA